MKNKNATILVVYATTFNSLGDPHSDIPVVGLNVSARKRVDAILAALEGRRTRWERSGQKRPSLFWAMEEERRKLEAQYSMPRRILST